MKLHIFDCDFLFDEFPKIFNPTHKIFITHLLDVDKLRLPQQKPKIYTSAVIAGQLIFYFKSKYNDTLTKDNFIILSAFKPVQLKLPNSQQMRVLMCKSETADQNFMLLFEKDQKVTHFYAGVCTNLRSFIRNDIFCAWIRQGVEKLYVHLGRANETVKEREILDTVDEIEALFDSHRNDELSLRVPVFGYAEFIALLAERLPGRLAIDNWFYIVNFGHTHKHLNFHNTNLDKSKEPSVKYITVSLLKGCPVLVQNGNIKRLKQFAIPTPFDLQLLVALVRPAHIYGINSINELPPNVPNYLINLIKRKSLSKVATPSRRNTPSASSPTAQSGKPLPKAQLSPKKDTPAVYRLTKKTIQYLDESDDESL